MRRRLDFRHTQTWSSLPSLSQHSKSPHTSTPILQASISQTNILRVEFFGRVEPINMQDASTKSPTASGKAALSWWKNGVHPAGRRFHWPAVLWSTAASSTDAALKIVSLINMWVLTTVHEIRNTQPDSSCTATRMCEYVSEGGMIRLKTLVELKFLDSRFSSLSSC